MTALLVEDLRFALDVGRSLTVPRLEVGAGERLVVFGPNGSGKTTLLRLLAGTLGSGLIPDLPPSGYLPQRPYVFRGSARWNLLLGVEPGRTERALELAAGFGLGDRLDRPARSLSGGERQRLALARVLAGTAPFVFLDEPLAALDAQDRMQVARAFAEALEERAAVIVTHDHDEAAVLGDRVAVMIDGVVRQTGPVGEVFAMPADDEVAAVVGLGNVLDGNVFEVSGALAAMRAGPIVLWGLADAVEPGDRARALFGAEAVTIYPGVTESAGSARNLWPGRLAAIRPAGRLIELLVDAGVQIAALVTPGAMEALGLEEGDELLVAVKATAIRVVAG